MNPWSTNPPFYPASNIHGGNEFDAKSGLTYQDLNKIVYNILYLDQLSSSEVFTKYSEASSCRSTMMGGGFDVENMVTGESIHIAPTYIYLRSDDGLGVKFRHDGILLVEEDESFTWSEVLHLIKANRQ